MKRKILKNTIVISGVVGGIVLLNKQGVYATGNINKLPQKSHEENINNRLSNRGQVIGVGSTCLRIRSLPSTDSEILGTMREGMKFDIISKSHGWYKIKYNNITGYAFEDFIEEINTPSIENILYLGRVYNAEPNLRVRSASSLNASVIGYLVNNTEISIVEAENDWYKIKYNGAYGYVYKNYILVRDNTILSKGNYISGNIGSDEDKVVANSTGYAYNLDGVNLRIREKSSINSNVLGALYDGNLVNIIGEENNWYKISYKNSVAYVCRDYITYNKPSHPNNNVATDNKSKVEVISKGMIVNVEGSNLRVRQGASTKHFVLGYLLNKEKVDILGKESNWYKIKYGNSIGYVCCDYVKILGGNISSTESTSQPNAYNTILKAIKSQVGSPYVWGGSGEYITSDSLNRLKSIFPTETANGEYNYAEKYVNQGYRAFDCSGLIQWGFAQANINIGRTTYDQINSGSEISIDSVKPGDLLFMSNLCHVGMYIGDNKWIESPYTGSEVRIRNVPWSYVERVRRILN